MVKYWGKVSERHLFGRLRQSSFNTFCCRTKTKFAFRAWKSINPEILLLKIWSELRALISVFMWSEGKKINLQTIARSVIKQFLGAKAPLELAHVKKKKWRLRQGSSGILPKFPWRSLNMKGGGAKKSLFYHFLMSCNVLRGFVKFCNFL